MKTAEFTGLLLRNKMLLSLVGSVVSLIERIVDKHTDMERELDDLVVRVDALERAHVTEPAA